MARAPSGMTQTSRTKAPGYPNKPYRTRVHWGSSARAWVGLDTHRTAPGQRDYLVKLKRRQRTTHPGAASPEIRRPHVGKRFAAMESTQRHQAGARAAFLARSP